MCKTCLENGTANYFSSITPEHASREQPLVMQMQETILKINPTYYLCLIHESQWCNGRWIFTVLANKILHFSKLSLPLYFFVRFQIYCVHLLKAFFITKQSSRFRRTFVCNRQHRHLGCIKIASDHGFLFNPEDWIMLGLYWTVIAYLREEDNNQIRGQLTNYLSGFAFLFVKDTALLMPLMSSTTKKNTKWKSGVSNLLLEMQQISNV